MKNHILYNVVLFSFLIIACGNIQAKEREHVVQGRVFDQITGKGIDHAKVYLMTADSVVIDTISTDGWDEPGLYQFHHLTKVGNYIVKASHDGYEDGCVNFTLHYEREWTMFPKPIMLLKIYKLREVTVTSSKLKMVMNGDTIVYNADAFNLADGSMLDALIARLPGAKLTKDGQIFLNGKFVEDLLVNGQDFFSGNPKMALENLPAYTVKNIKVYDKRGAASTLMNRDMGDKTYVMDVRLKKEYSTGYLGNVEAGIGTSHRYSVKGLGVKFSDRERLGIYTNINNLNDNQRADALGEWSPQDMPEGLLATKDVGLSYYYLIGGKMTDFLSTTDNYTHTGADNQSTSSSQTFLPDGDSFHHGRTSAMSSTDKWSTRNQFYLQKKKYYTVNDFNLTYLSSHGWGNSNAETSDSSSVLNRVLSANSVESKNTDVEFKNEDGIRIIADMIRWNVKMNYNRNTQKRFSLDDVQYPNGSLPRDYRNNYQDELNQHFNLTAGASYSYGIDMRSLNVEYTYTYMFDKSSNMLYRLDKLSGRDSSRFNLLPSASEALLNVIDNGNSYLYHEYRNEHKIEFSTRDMPIGFLNANMHIRLPLRIISGNLYYERMGRHDVSRQRCFFEPDITFEHLDNINWQISGGMTSDFPDLTSMVDYRDDSNPLLIQLGNANLRDIHRYHVDGFIEKRGNNQKMIHLGLGYSQTDNDVAYGLTYDKSTGISTIQPLSVNGNWRGNMVLNYTRAIDKKERLTLDNQFSLDYNHNVDMATVEGYDDSQRSIVHNWLVSDVLKLNFRLNDDYEFTLHGGGNYNIIKGERDGFSNIHAGDYNVGMNAQVSLPWSFNLTTDMTMFARRGYQSDELNTTDWVWNAQLTHSLIKGKLIAKLQGFDLLHQLSNTQYAVNAQGRTETWHNSIPRYVMLSLSWRFNVNPKKKQ